MGQAIFIIGPAGSGKTNFCRNFRIAGEGIRRNFKIINLDPANIDDSNLYYSDIREFITVDEVQENTDLGPNGGLILALQEMTDNFSELELESLQEDFLLFDCPGQIELFLHSQILNEFIENLKQNFSVTVIFLLDALYLADPYKYIHGLLTAYISSIKFTVPRLNVITKLDLIEDKNFDFYKISREMKNKLQIEKSFYGTMALKLFEFLEENENLCFTTIDWEDEDSIINLVYDIDMLSGYWEEAETKENFYEE